ncbi:SRPBCC family protein [Winogradskyella sp.]|uniref:SRPBCC family protein n=1 Tax=Winogradskyella sp. TaxID=1883156 RepID=UPI003BACBF5B
MSDLANRTATIEKTFNAPLKLVWDAWTQSEHIVKWWAPKGMAINVIEHNFEVGGTWKYSMLMPDGNEFISEGKYTEILIHEKIVTQADFKPMTQNVEIQIHFEADKGQTKFTFKVIHATPEYRKQQEEMGFYNGWGSAFDRLDMFLKDAINNTKNP